MSKAPFRSKFCDENFMQVCSEILRRRLVFIMIPKEVGDNGTGLKEIMPQTHSGSPLYLLHFSDTHFASPHFQSVRPINDTVSSLVQRRTIRIFSVPDETADFVPEMESSKVPAVGGGAKRTKKSREASYMDQSNVLSSSSKRRRKK